MHALHLRRSVTITGTDYFNRPASISFHPYDKAGWFWKTKDSGIQPITPDLLQYRKRRLSLIYGKDELTVFEHIGALRFTGLDGILIESSPWPPYHGRTLELWEALNPHCKDGGKALRWYTPIHPVRCDCAGNPKRFTKIVPSQNKCLTALVAIDYPDLGEIELCHGFDGLGDASTLESIFAAKSQGWPMWLYHPSRVLQWFPRRPPHKMMTWPQEHAPHEALRLFSEHRLLDMLGGISVLVPPGGMLAGNIVSMRSGHHGDMRVVSAVSRSGIISIP